MQDIFIADGRGYYKDERTGLTLPEVAADRSRLLVIGTHVVNTALQRHFLEEIPDARLDRGEAMVMIDFPVFDAAARDYLGMQPRETIVVSSRIPPTN